MIYEYEEHSFLHGAEAHKWKIHIHVVVFLLLLEKSRSQHITLDDWEKGELLSL